MKKPYVWICLFFCFGCAAVVSEPDYAVSARNTLDRMNAAYAEKNLDAFKSHVDKNSVFDYENFMTAVENDFNGFVSVSVKTVVKNVAVRRSADEESLLLFVKADFERRADTYRFGKTVDEGETVLVFKIMDDGALKLKEMSEPHLYGLIVP